MERLNFLRLPEGGKKNIYEEAGVPGAVLDSSMRQAQQLWLDMYLNRPFWKKTVYADGMSGLSSAGEIYGLNLPAIMTEELARLVVGEEVRLHMEGRGRARFLQEFMERSVLPALRRQVAYCAALGGVVFKPYLDANNTLQMSFVLPESFLPLDFDNAGVTGAVMTSSRRQGRYTYTRLEIHRMLPNHKYLVQNRLFRSDGTRSAHEEVPLSEVADYAGLCREAVLENIKRPLFVYFKMPNANHIDPQSPLGVSIYSSCVDVMRQVDITFDALINEIELGERRIFIGDSMVKLRRDKEGNPIASFNKRDRVFRQLQFDGGREGVIHDAPSLRVADLRLALQTQLDLATSALGFTQGSFSFDDRRGSMTATQVLSENSKLFRTMRDVENALQSALEQTLEVAEIFADLYGLAPKGWYGSRFVF
ncbi:MAG: phage portal protein, partial [Clostridiales bacterium]|nr:phage portal protein [Clostridiales bacterium]